MAKSLTERILQKKIIVKEQEAERYIKQNMVIANVRYSAYLKTHPLGFVFFGNKSDSQVAELRREANKEIIVLIATGNERMGTIKALVDFNGTGNYSIANTCFYHINPETKVLSVDAIKTENNCRGKGVGGAVINFVKDIAIYSNCPQVELDSVRSAVTFYKKMGFDLGDKQIQTCPDGSLKTMVWNVGGNYNTKNFTVNELNLMLQRGREQGKGK